jgi:similar to stage IV sporulation protein
MKNKVKIKVFDEYNTLCNYLIYHRINYSDLKINNNTFYLIVSFNDYKRINRLYNTIVIKYYGRRELYEFIKFHKYMLISFTICLFILHLLTNTIFDIRIDSEDEDIKNIIMRSLNDNGISIYKKKKSFEEINEIKKRILEENKNILEWIEISNKGCVYNVYVTKRNLNEIKSNNGIVGSIIAQKDGLIKHITSSRGNTLVELNDYVKKGDILISGNILKNDELITRVKAEGKVYAEVWYIVSVNIPFKYTEYSETGKVINRYYIRMFNNEFTLIGKYDSSNTINEKKMILSKPYLPFKLYKETKTEYDYKEYTINESDALSEALKRSEKEIKNRLDNDEYVISKKVLKKEVNSSKMYIEVFFKVYENIGYTSNIDKIGENNARSN